MTIFQRQCLLNFLGYTTGGIDGIWGAQSRNATEAAQEDLGIPADGVWGEQTESAILEAVYTYDIDAPFETDTNVGSNPELDELFAGIRYWSSEELRCRCGEYHEPYCDGFPVMPDRTLLELLDDIRDHFGRPAIRSSGIRCPQHNADSGGVGNSKHMQGKAMDFSIPGVSGEAVRAYAAADPRCSYTYVIEGNWVHVDVN